jgi:DNA-directed RNA polymerase specialized sigma24 family protein
MSDHDKKPPEKGNDVPPKDEGAPESGPRASHEDKRPPEGDAPRPPPIDRKVVRRFLESKKAWNVAKAAIAKVIPPEEVEDLVVEALADALASQPPHAEAALVSWLYRIAYRRAVDWLRKRTRREKYEGPMPTRAALEDAYTGESLDDGGDLAGSDLAIADEAENRLTSHLDVLIGDNAKERELREILREHAEGKTYKAIAAERGYTEDQIASRIRRFKLKYAKTLKRRRQRMLLLWLLGGLAIAGAVALLLWWLFYRGELEDRRHVEPWPAPTAPPTPTLGREGLPVSHPRPSDRDE